eukprot:TRINITY_DN13260_c1_g1_i1.p1 TRINITY_DN13260_c1_g1~~TRINITY_DN13260_c1_g1_i1.p1  ORF type:complete len:128 (+),score=15.80 TRINITY_DN13260_c1_g1_i1:133-516(+)
MASITESLKFLALMDFAILLPSTFRAPAIALAACQAAFLMNSFLEVKGKVKAKMSRKSVPNAVPFLNSKKCWAVASEIATFAAVTMVIVLGVTILAVMCQLYFYMLPRSDISLSENVLRPVVRLMFR